MGNRAPEEQRAARPRRGIRVEALLALAFGTLLAVALIEGVGRAYFALHPAYDVIFLEPDRWVGWKLAPNLRFTWTGTYAYAADFSVEVQANSLGFRDVERTVDPPAGTTRIALLGNSMVEALQVPTQPPKKRNCQCKTRTDRFPWYLR